MPHLPISYNQRLHRWLRGFTRWRPLVENVSGALLVVLGVLFVAQ